MKYRKLIGTVGDCNPLEHNGGLIIRNTYGDYTLVYFRSVPADCLPPKSVRYWDVFIIDLDTSYWDWIDVPGLAASCGQSEDTINEAMKSEDPLMLASLAESIGWYHGFYELDHESCFMSKTEINRYWGRWV